MCKGVRGCVRVCYGCVRECISHHLQPMLTKKLDKIGEQKAAAVAATGGGSGQLGQGVFGVIGVPV